MAQSNYYLTYLITVNSDLRARVSAAASEEAKAALVDIGDPESWAVENRWDWVGPDWDEKVASAVEAGITDWGKDPSVITDGDVLSAVQPLISGLQA